MVVFRLCFSNAVGQLLTMNVSTLVPGFADDNHPFFSSFWIGVMFCAYQIAAVVSAPIVAKYAGSYGRRRSIIYGLIMMTSSTIVFGLAGFIQNDYGWYFLSLLARVFQGLGDSLILVVSPSIIAIEFPDKNLEYQGYFEAAMGLGLMMGPVISVIFYRWLGYIYTFFLFSAIIALTGLPMAFSLPKHLDGGKDDDARQIDVPYSWFLKEKRAVMMLLSSGMVAVCLCFMEPVLVLRLEALGMSEENTGLGYVLMSVTYVVGAAVIASATEKVDHRITVSACLLGESVSLFVASAIGYESLTETLIGIGFAGFFCAGIFVPSIPETTKSMLPRL